MNKPDLSPEEIAAMRVQLTLRAADLWDKQMTNPTADKAEAIALCERLIAKLSA